MHKNAQKCASAHRWMLGRFCQPQRLAKKQQSSVDCSWNHTHTHNIGWWVRWLWDAQGTTVRGKMDVEPALSAPKACQKSSGAVLIVAGTTHTHNIGRWVLWLWDAQGTTVRGKMDVGPALSAPKACQKQRSSVDCSWNHTHTQHWVMG
jgi:Flp pilus assembly pilin Flp